MIPVFALLVFAVLTIWAPERWAWSAFQIGVFAIGGIRLWRPEPIRPPAVWLTLAAAAVWPLIQLVLHTTVSRGATWDAALDWFTFLVLFFVVSQEDVRRFLPALVILGTILGVGAVEKMPAVVDGDAIAIRSQAHLALTFDHRLIDGALADQFCQKVKSILENWSANIL